MSMDVNRMKGRLALMMACCGVAFLAAVAGFLAYFQFGQSWGRWAAVAALAIGFAGQMGLMLSLRRAPSLGEETARETRVGKGT